MSAIYDLRENPVPGLEQEKTGSFFFFASARKKGCRRWLTDPEEHSFMTHPGNPALTGKLKHTAICQLHRSASESIIVARGYHSQGVYWLFVTK